MVLCAGFGTRLRPLTDKVPKPLVPLCGLPLLQYNFALLLNAGVRDIVVNTHYLGAEMEKGARELAASMGIELQVSREEKQILGTGGGVRRAQAMLGRNTFFLLNGDMLFDVDLGAALSAHKAAGAVATMVLAPYPKGATYGAVEVDAAFNVRRIAGRGAVPEPGLMRMHFTGVHILEPELLDRLGHASGVRGNGPRRGGHPRPLTLAEQLVDGNAGQAVLARVTRPVAVDVVDHGPADRRGPPVTEVLAGRIGCLRRVRAPDIHPMPERWRQDQNGGRHKFRSATAPVRRARSRRSFTAPGTGSPATSRCPARRVV